MVQTFRFQGAEEVFHRGIVVGAAGAGHGRGHIIFLNQVEVCLGRVLRALVTVECKSASDLFSLQSLVNCVGNKGGQHLRTNLPRQYNLSAQVQDSAYIQHPSRNRDIGDIRHPELVEPRLIELAIQQIRVPVNRLLVTGVRLAAANNRQQAEFPHDAQDRLDIHPLSCLTLEPATDTANTVGLPAQLLTFHDQTNQPLILRFLSLSISPPM